MPSAALAKFRDKLSKGRPVSGIWVTLEAPAVTELAVLSGLDWVVIDAEHGALDWGDIAGHLRAAVRSETLALVRIAELNGALIKRALDLGADGVVIPWVESADQLRQAVDHCRYPPEGVRGIGAERATGWGQTLAEYVASANDEMLVIPIIETVAAGKNLEEMLQVPGVDLFYFGPADYSSTAGYRGTWEGPGVADELLRINNQIRAQGKFTGIVVRNESDLALRVQQGFQMIGLGLDAGMLLREIGRMASAAESAIAANCPATSPGTIENPLPSPPEAFRPDRPEQMVSLADAPVTEIAPGAIFHSQVGAHNAAIGLTTGFVKVAPLAKVPPHTHGFAESITVLEGRVAADVDDRRYLLGPLDNISIPSGLVHAVRNLSDSNPATLHIAMASSQPSRTLATGPQSEPQIVAEGANQRFGPEQVNWFATARKYSPGPGAEFIDFCNDTLLPGFEMSGGYGRFTQHGRLPAHLHDFDESITIIDGTATCLVEGREYQLLNRETALQPRGRIHFFRNDRTEPMAMIWFYAGPQPDRIIVDESCATLAGDPWTRQQGEQ